MKEFIMKLQPIIKWLGGKNREYKIFASYFPNGLENFDYIVEPFAGSISTSLNIFNNIKNNNLKFIFNDLDENLIIFYNFIKKQNSKFYKYIEDFEKQREIFRKKYNEIKLFQNFNKKNIFDFEFLFEKNKEVFFEYLETNIKHYKIDNKPELNLEKYGEILYFKSLYEYARYIMNDNKENYEIEFYIANWYYIKEFAFSGTVRYNSKGKFNVPYGGKGYNKKNFIKKIKNAYENKTYRDFFEKSKFHNLDYQEFFQWLLKNIEKNKKYFIFLDPPYDTTFKNYLNNSVFEKKQQIILANILKNIKDKYNNIYFMLIINESELINKLYKLDFYILNKYNKKYSVNFKNCNNRKLFDHLIITNYTVNY